MTSGRDIDEQTKRQIQKLREAGLSVREVARAALVATSTVQRVLHQRSETSK